MRGGVLSPKLFNEFLQDLRKYLSPKYGLKIEDLYRNKAHCDVWKNHRVENANRLIKQVKLCLNNIYKADWSNKARNSIKLRTYIKFKFDHSLEEYLFYIPDTRWMKALSRLRMSSHMLEIERGRHVKP